MKRTFLISFCLLTVIFTACNSKKATIYKTWNFSRAYVSDTAKASPWLSAATSMASSMFSDYKLQFNSDNTSKSYKGNTVVSDGKIELEGSNSIKLALTDSMAVYKYELTDTSLNLINGPLVMHFTAAK